MLAAVAQMPVSSWAYKSDDPSVRHLGPMAQDFYSAFRLGDTDRAYDPIDAHGVALAAIKALAEQVQEQNARIESLERENRELQGDEVWAVVSRRRAAYDAASIASTACATMSPRSASFTGVAGNAPKAAAGLSAP